MDKREDGKDLLKFAYLFDSQDHCFHFAREKGLWESNGRTY